MHLKEHFSWILIYTEPAPVIAPVKEEPEKIKKWREEQKARLEEKGIKIKILNIKILML